MTRREHRRSTPLWAWLAAATLTTLLSVVALPAAGARTGATAQDDDPALDQELDVDQPVAEDRAVLDSGHVDMGPRFVDGEWRLLVHDDSDDAGSVWRHPERTAFRVGDAGRSEVPEDPAYSFLGVDPGEPVHLIPQVQLPGVVWLGWNTQDPEVMDRIDRGVALTLVDHDGPGRVTVYLQGGNFAEPDVLWSSADTDPTPIWVETNTHTHANWVFTEPGVHLLAIRADATLLGGEEVSDTAVVRVEVGDGTARGASLDADVPAGFGTDAGDGAAASGDAAEEALPAGADDGSGSTTVVLLLVLVAGAVLLAVVGVVALRNARVRRSAS